MQFIEITEFNGIEEFGFDLFDNYDQPFQGGFFL